MVKVGDTIMLTRSALENYSDKYKGKRFRVTHVAYSRHQHPGYDEGVGGPLIDVAGLSFSLYRWEFRVVNGEPTQARKGFHGNVGKKLPSVSDFWKP